MKKKLLYLTFYCLLILSLVGCSSEVTEGPGDVTAHFLNALQQQNYSSVKQYYSENVDNLSHFKNKVESISPLVANELFNKLADFSYIIEKIELDEKDENKASVLLTMKSYDLGKVFENTILDYLKTDLTMSFNGATADDIIKEAEKIIVEDIKNSQKTFNETVTVTLSRENNTWKIDELEDNIPFLNALSGNIIYTVDQLSEILDDME